jgi:hypothetical protein
MHFHVITLENRFPRMLRMLWTGSIPLNSPLNLLDDVLLFHEADIKKKQRVAHEIVFFCRRMR